MNTVPLAIALLTAAQPSGITIPDFYHEVCFAVARHHHLTCGLVHEDFNPFDGRVEFMVEDAAFDEFMMLPWSDRFPDVSIERVSTDRYNGTRENATVGGVWFDFRGAGRDAPGGNMLEVVAWGESAQQDLPGRMTLNFQDRTVSADGGPPQTPSAFVDSRLAAGSSECTVAILGGFMTGAFKWGTTGAAGGATLGALVGGFGAGPGAVAGGALGAAWGAVAGSLEAAADHCYGGNDKPAGGQDSTATGQGNTDGATDTNGGQDGAGTGQEGGSSSPDSEGGNVADGSDAGGVCEPDTGNATPDPDSVELTEESAAAVATLGLGGRPALEPTTKFESLIDPQREDMASSRVGRHRPLNESNLDPVILHDGSLDDNDWWGPVDPHDFDLPDIAPIDPRNPHGRQ